MITEVIPAYLGEVMNQDLGKRKLNMNGIKRAGEVLKAGGLVAFPTETVYGLGGLALDKTSARMIYAAKGRPSDNPLIVHIARLEDLNYIVKDVPVKALMLAMFFWPGPLTMILEKSNKVPKETTGGLSTVAVRMPNDPAALALIKEAGGYIAAPSANRSGRPSPTMAKHVLEDLNGKIEIVLDGGHVGIGLESTIVDLSVDEPKILRPGFIGEAEVMKALAGDGKQYFKEQHKSEENCEEEDAHPKAPGMKYRHYAPKGEMLVLTGEWTKIVSEIEKRAKEAFLAGEQTGVLCSEETAQKMSMTGARVFINGSLKDPKSIAAGLFENLRAMDEAGCTKIFAEGYPEEGVFYAVMNRLKKAAGGNVVKL